jgi:integral membrane protein
MLDDCSIISPVINRNFLRYLRTMGTIEGISTLILFGVAMPLKYLAGMPMAVKIAGSIHGLLFVLLAVMFILAIKRVPIPRSLAALGIVAAVVPLGPFVMDRKLVRLAEGAPQSGAGRVAGGKREARNPR